MAHTMSRLFEANGESHLLLNPRLSLAEKSIYESFFAHSQDYRDHLWLLSSGSSRRADESAKLIGLSKKAFLVSAAATNRHLNVGAVDRWAVALPHFHVGGLSIHARCNLAGATAVLQPELLQQGSAEERARAFTAWIRDEHITLLSLVPTQIFDLVTAGCVAPAGLRAVMLGGAALDSRLYRQARQLSWPLLPSYGMTETCSNIATAPLASLADNTVPTLRVLDHAEVRLEADGRLSVSSASLLTGYWQRVAGRDHFTDPKIEGWYTSQDLAEISGGIGHQTLLPKGRQTEFVKIKGEGVDLAGLRSRLADFLLEQGFSQPVALVDLPDARDGARLLLVYEPGFTIDLEVLLERWNKAAFPLERIFECRQLPRIPRSELGKVLWNELRSIV